MLTFQLTDPELKGNTNKSMKKIIINTKYPPQWRLAVRYGAL